MVTKKTTKKRACKRKSTTKKQEQQKAEVKDVVEALDKINEDSVDESIITSGNPVTEDITDTKIDKVEEPKSDDGEVEDATEPEQPKDEVVEEVHVVSQPVTPSAEDARRKRRRRVLGF